jgi:hypothetical protein
MKHDTFDKIIKGSLIVGIALNVYFFREYLTWYINLFSSGIITFLIAIFIAYLVLEITYKIVTEIFDTIALLRIQKQIRKYADPTYLAEIENDIQFEKNKLLQLRNEISLDEFETEEEISDEMKKMRNIFKV